MASREQSGTNVEPGLIQRIAQGARYMISGVTPNSFFGPMQPLQPQAQDKTEGRGWDYPVGLNIRIQPRSEEAISFAQLRGLADAYDLLRLVIETRKDQIKSFEWEVTSRDEDDTEDKYADQIKLVQDFLQSPDKEHAWDDWLGMFVEDLLVIDAVCVYPRMNRGGKLYGLELVDGATVKRLIDDGGRTPLPPSPAYQQILKGIPAADYSRDNLIYMMRNPRTWKVYGYSPVEQVIMTVNIALRRQVSQLEFYTAGNIPEAIAQTPETWTPKQVNDFQVMWDNLNEGNTAQRRKMRFIPSLKDITFPKKEMLKDEYDEWLARIICFAFSIPPTAFIKQNNRATGEQAADTAKEEGLMPLMKWIESKLNYIIWNQMGVQGVRFRWKMVNKVDAQTQATIHQTYIASEVITPDEAREDLGKAPMTTAEREAAFPMPAAFDPTLGPDRKPNAPAGGAAPVATPADKGENPAQQGPTGKAPADLAAEKFVINVTTPDIRMGDTFVRVMPAEAPIVKFEAPKQPDIHVGDNIIRNPQLAPPEVKKPPPRRMVAKRMADGSMVAEFQDAETPMEKSDNLVVTEAGQ